MPRAWLTTFTKWNRSTSFFSRTINLSFQSVLLFPTQGFFHSKGVTVRTLTTAADKKVPPFHKSFMEKLSDIAERPLLAQDYEGPQVLISELESYSDYAFVKYMHQTDIGIVNLLKKKQTLLLIV